MLYMKLQVVYEFDSNLSFSGLSYFSEKLSRLKIKSVIDSESSKSNVLNSTSAENSYRVLFGIMTLRSAMSRIS
jgi:hypothetical protein